ncbi:hypothetical protein NJ76_27465 [Rhodococcus sp. IITR03]|nr:hypothetical protein NJ76_27465 [Rhodococcus sp. IITR03]
MTTVGIATGAGRGMGYACAQRMIGTVDTVLLVDLDADTVRATADELNGDRTRVEPFVLDVTDVDGLERLAARVTELGTCDRSHTPRASRRPWPTGDGSSPSTWSEPHGSPGRSVHSRPRAPRRSTSPRWHRTSGGCSRHRKRSPCSRIRSPRTSSTVSGRSWGRRSNIPASLCMGEIRCAAVRTRRSRAARGGRCPRMLRVAGHHRHSQGRQEADHNESMGEMVRATPLGRTGRAEELAAVVAFLLPDEASFVNGTDVLVDGGVVASLASGADRASVRT